jgi:site-specific DNA-methyltransferase (adenine-specific)
MKLLHGDCLELMKSIPDGSIDAIIIDPPYGTTACKWDSVIPFEPMWVELKRIIKPNGAIVLFGSEPFSSALRISNIKQYKYDWVWQKNRHSSPLLAKKQPLRIYENISVFYKEQPIYNPQGLIEINKTMKNSKSSGGEIINGERGKTSLIGEYKQQFTNYPIQVIKFDVESNPVHGTQKPVGLLEYLIKTYTQESETVLDFTMGSGTTGVACKNLNRNFIGIELDEGYFNIAKERING